MGVGITKQLLGQQFFAGIQTFFPFLLLLKHIEIIDENKCINLKSLDLRSSPFNVYEKVLEVEKQG